MIKPWKISSRKPLGNGSKLLTVYVITPEHKGCSSGCAVYKSAELHVLVARGENEDDVILEKLLEEDLIKPLQPAEER